MDTAFTSLKSSKKVILTINKKRSLMSRSEFLMDQLKREQKILSNTWYYFVTITGIMVFLHNILTNGVYFLHKPGERLLDIGFYMVPEIPWLFSASDYLCNLIIFAFLAFLTCPFFILPNRKPKPNRQFFTTAILLRFALSACTCVLLRCLSFLVTILPSPAKHCLPNSNLYNPPNGILEIMTRMDFFTGCGDLIFSSHTLLVLNVALTVHHYCEFKAVKIFVWSLVALMMPLIISGRHHYTVDIVIASYVVPLVWNFVLRFNDPKFPVLNSDTDLIEN